MEYSILWQRCAVCMGMVPAQDAKHLPCGQWAHPTCSFEPAIVDAWHDSPQLKQETWRDRPPLL